jgi:hypothetical protein
MQVLITYLDIDPIGILDVKAQDVVAKREAFLFEIACECFGIEVVDAKHDVVDFRFGTGLWSR